MTVHPRVDLLRLFCAQLPEPCAALIRSLDPHDPQTHVEAYLIARHLGVRLPEELLDSFLESLCECLDQTAATLHPPHDPPVSPSFPATRRSS
ncbi:hypothetical protein ABIE44_003119 [Marmoricola sp. OAE513]|uniref:hypothetical protein n=1 Tax=Marmoricola sp. OAE513 TaxID=2817894 RepID=UPI001AE23C0B